MTETLNLKERVALVWYREHGPAGISAAGAPERRLRIALIQRGLVHISPLRSIGDPIKYDITTRGREALQP